MGKGQQCHLDPDLREGIIERKQDFIPAFGQCGVAKKFLDEMDVEVGDLFLFFGRFRETEFSSEGKLQYKRNATEQHIIFGICRLGKSYITTKLISILSGIPTQKMGRKITYICRQSG